jgi:GPH family glycoside/pentoside/hexuronide:cation symporter
MTLLQKVGLAGGLFLVGLALDMAGFVSEAPQQPDSALLAIRAFMGPAPLVMLLCAIALAYFYPITREIHDDIRLKLAERKRN